MIFQFYLKTISQIFSSYSMGLYLTRLLHRIANLVYPFVTTQEPWTALQVIGETLLDKHQPPPIRMEADANVGVWWRRGRVELPVQKTFRTRTSTGLAGI